MNHSLDRAVGSVLTDFTGRTSTPLLQTQQHASSQNDEESISSEGYVEIITQDVENISQKQKSEQSAARQTFVSLAAGAAAGAIAKTTIAPFDRTKIYFQVTNGKFTLSEASSYIIRSYHKYGFLSLWRGNSATMARIIPYSAIQFASHERYKKLLGITDKNGTDSTKLRFLAGSLAGASSQAATYPLDLVRARMAVTPSIKFKSMTQVFVATWKIEGPLSLYKGFRPTLLGVIPYAGTSFATYGTLKQLHGRKTGRDTPHPLERMAFGAVSGLFGQTASYPLDIVRRRMQTAQITGNSHQYQTIIQTLTYVYKNEGLVHGLYKGLSLNWVKGPISVGISFATFDTLKELLQSHFLHDD